MSKIADKIQNLDGRGPFKDDYERAQTMYFNWLCNIVHVDDYAGKTWYILAKILHNIEFYWTVSNDDNRANDGVRLRETWLNMMKIEAEDLGVGVGVPLDALNGGCSVLEMLVGLASRIESDIMQSDELGNQTGYWFWDMVHNLLQDYGLIIFQDNEIDSHHGDIIRNRVMTFLDRSYDFYGRNGGLFPLAETNVDQRDVEIWYQAQRWLAENYPEYIK